MTTPGHSDHDSDPDPTGIRALLSSLPDPGPMPEELVDRITTSLREEQRRRESVAEDRGRVVSLDEERQRRRPTRVLSALGAAAAVAVAATVATSQIFGGGTSADLGASAQYGQDTADSAGADGGAQDDAGATEDEDQGAPDVAGPDAAGGDREQEEGAEAGGGAPGDGQQLFDAAPEVVVVPGTLALTRDAFVEQLRQEVGAWQAGERSGASSGGLGSEDATACTRSVPDALQPRAELHVSAGTLDGDDMVVLVQTAPGPTTAWVLPSSCARGPAELLHGPVVVD